MAHYDTNKRAVVDDGPPSPLYRGDLSSLERRLADLEARVKALEDAEAHKIEQAERG